MLLLKDHIMDNIHLPQFSQGPENIGQGNLTGQKTVFLYRLQKALFHRSFLILRYQTKL